MIYKVNQERLSRFTGQKCAQAVIRKDNQGRLLRERDANGCGMKLHFGNSDLISNHAQNATSWIWYLESNHLKDITLYPGSGSTLLSDVVQLS